MDRIADLTECDLVLLVVVDIDLTRANERRRLRLRLGRGGRQANLRAKRVNVALLSANQIGSLYSAETTLREQEKNQEWANQPIRNLSDDVLDIRQTGG